VSGADLWVFGYGSLMWKPGFPFVEQRRAVLTGFHRALCIYSVRYRGSSRFPGLVFGLEAGGHCEGMAFRVAGTDVAATVDYLRDREQVTGVYRAEMRSVRLVTPERRTVRALTFIANPSARQYAGKLPFATQTRIVLASKGASGPNAEYVRNTAEHLGEMGIRDREIEQVVAMLGAAGKTGALLPYPRHLAPSLPSDRALRSGYQRNVRI
jgi:glutathione-specific gamma-glutamylcyclotransferase